MARASDTKPGPIDRLILPIASLVLVVVAMIHSLLDRRRLDTGPDPSATVEPADAAPAGRLERLSRLPVIGRAIQVQKRYGELRGENNLAASVAFQSFLSIFPLMLVIIAVVGFVSAGSSTDLAGSIVNNLGLTGDAARSVQDAIDTATESRRAASVIGFAGLLWSGLGLVAALQYAYNQVWQVEERGVKDKVVGMLWLVGAAVLFVASAAMTTVLRWLPGVMAPLGIVIGLLVTFGVWLWTSKLLPNRDVDWKRLVPGALLGAIGLEVLKVVGAYYVPRAVSSSSQLYGSLGVVLAVLAWLLVFSRLVVYSAVLDVVLFERDRGTIKTVIEVPATPGARPDETTRSGRVEKEDIAADGEPVSDGVASGLPVSPWRWPRRRGRATR